MVKAKHDEGLSEAESPASLHRIPVIDKMLELLHLLQQSADGLSINALVIQSGQPRSTVYRILNTLSTHDILARRHNGQFVLGRRLASLASAVDMSLRREDLIELGHQFLLELADRTGETCKLSILVDERAEVIDVAQSPSDLAPASRVGSSFLLHAGAASKLLLAHAPSALVERILASELVAHTAMTITDPRKLQCELRAIRESGLSFDRGEWNMSVHAVAAPVFGHDGAVIAAMSATHFASPDEGDIRIRVMAPLQSAARALSMKLGHVSPREEGGTVALSQVKRRGRLRRAEAA